MLFSRSKACATKRELDDRNASDAADNHHYTASCAMDAESFRKAAECGEIPIDCHKLALRIAYIYTCNGSYDEAVFLGVKELHKRGWSFGSGDLKFNRTLDGFYFAQIIAATWRQANHGKGDFPERDDFDDMYVQHQNLLHEDVWKEYYTPKFLREETTSRFYRLPDLQDLPDTTGDMGKPRQKGVGHFSKLPRWAHLVVRTHRKKPEIPVAVLTETATTTLRQSIARLQEENPEAQIQPYSETQAYFWLKRMGLDSPYRPSVKWLWDPDYAFGAEVAIGEKDLWAWEAHYSPELWASSASAAARLEPDLDGTRESGVIGCGWPESAGLVVEAWSSGWDPEVGSAEEVAFLAGIALNETEELLADAGRTLNCAIRSHILLGALRAACAQQLGNVRPASTEAWAGVFRKMLEENGQLFWQWVPRKFEKWSKDCAFRLEPCVKIPE
ncbi:hypothetical protein LLEC1_05476 [Akanthomyces lecanii]|uniref:Uncharacterized protein n=1 Tax=Cordyceps confragosa TaxID=2714763 RepID=A0A179IK43_CORDF|nr:hypothetical protein LLEC1_05476 [Akanthomyces lecanii]